MSRLPLNPVHWLCFVAWEPGDTVLEMLKGENPGSLVFVFLTCIPRGGRYQCLHSGKKN